METPIDVSMNLYQRISAIMQDVAYLTKDDTVSTGGNNSYRAITEEKVTGTVRAAMIKHGVVIVPVEQAHTRTDERVMAFNKFSKKDEERINRVSTVDVKYRIQNIDDPDDFIIAASSGTGVDTQDKGVGKAMTYAYKYLLLRAFGIPTGEDPDKISSDLYTEKLTGQQGKEGPGEEQKGSISKRRAQLLVDIKATKWSEEKLNEASLGKYGKTLMQLTDDQLEEVLSLIVGKAAG